MNQPDTPEAPKFKSLTWREGGGAVIGVYGGFLFGSETLHSMHKSYETQQNAKLSTTTEVAIVAGPMCGFAVLAVAFTASLRYIIHNDAKRNAASERKNILSNKPTEGVNKELLPSDQPRLEPLSRDQINDLLDRFNPPR